MIHSINHVCYSVSNLSDSIAFYRDILKGKVLVEGRTTAYLDIGGLWVALNEEKDIPRNEIQHSYTHMAFSISESDFGDWQQWLESKAVNILKGRERSDGDRKSIYFTDPDGHKLELHTGTLEDRLDYYRKSKHRMKFSI
ncbi:metallothiol transferase FosB [Salinicoccus hispanicus]|uniref:Metallothiol transferase FosB n=1 Tax=Salinicoccus hispanicus TaxID=157225 RepID=A0A6N8U0W5_9STAP|nr:metallothiol transferase FosB [Salinicoccus hispanicus]MXQ49985.1 metallothiol transferase FosB [Salinicoccus hispanicus]